MSPSARLLAIGDQLKDGEEKVIAPPPGVRDDPQSPRRARLTVAEEPSSRRSRSRSRRRQRQPPESWMGACPNHMAPSPVIGRKAAEKDKQPKKDRKETDKEGQLKSDSDEEDGDIDELREWYEDGDGKGSAHQAETGKDKVGVLSTFGIQDGSYFIGVRMGMKVLKPIGFVGHRLSLTSGIELTLDTVKGVE
ncbi:unnamed protein product, partial [Prorocentrum cordatum]